MRKKQTKKIIRSISFLLISTFAVFSFTALNAKAETQEELLAQYYAALAKMQQEGTAPAQSNEPSQEELLAQYYAALAAQGGNVAPAPAVVPETVDKVVAYLDGDLNCYSEVQAAYSALPQNIKNYLNKRNITITSCSNAYVTSVRGSRVLGFCKEHKQYSSRSGLSLSNEVFIGDNRKHESGKQILYHELGHAIDNFLTQYNGDFVEASDRWPNGAWFEVQQYNSQKTINDDEAFAVAFEAFMNDPNKFAAKAPISYAYIMNIVGGLN